MIDLLQEQPPVAKEIEVLLLINVFISNRKLVLKPKQSQVFIAVDSFDIDQRLGHSHDCNQASWWPMIIFLNLKKFFNLQLNLLLKTMEYITRDGAKSKHYKEKLNCLSSRIFTFSWFIFRLFVSPVWWKCWYHQNMKEQNCGPSSQIFRFSQN